jgi:hypothetical protein
MDPQNQNNAETANPAEAAPASEAPAASESPAANQATNESAGSNAGEQASETATTATTQVPAGFDGPAAGVNGALAMMGPAILGFQLIFAVTIIASMWKVFTKANESGWKSIIPFYNLLVMLRIVRLPGYFLLLWFIPLVNLYAVIRTYHRFSRSFGKGGGFTFGLICLPLIFWPILAFGSSEYQPIEES